MDSDCVELLPYVCTALFDSEQALPDDTCLEKLLDWLTELTGRVPAASLLELCPCLVTFVCDVCCSQSAEPRILAFTLKLAGLLASSTEGFCHLKQQGVLKPAFGYHEWVESSLWQDATVRSGWIHGLQNMLRHWQAMSFLLENGLIKDILCLQLDSSLFVASAANRLLAAILTFPKALGGCSSHDQGCVTGQKEEQKACHGLGSPEWVDCIAQIVRHTGETLMCAVSSHTSQALRLVALSLAQCLPQVRDMLWQRTVEAMDVLKSSVNSSSVQAFLDVLKAAARVHLLSQENSSIVPFIEDMLCTLSPNVAIPFATGIVRLEHCPQSLKERAVSIILQPLIHVNVLLRLQNDSSDPVEKSCDQHIICEDAQSHNSSYVSMLCLSLTHTAELLNLESICEDASMPSVVSSVISVLSVSGGWSCPTSARLPCRKALTKLIGCSRVQKCALDTLSSLSQCPGSDVHVGDVLNIVLLYLQNPDSEPTVFQKTLQAGLNWLHTYSQSSASSSFLQQEIFPVLKRRLCDLRWEVRDSSLEFLSQLTSLFQDDASYCGILPTSGILDFLMALLSDPEAYVRASAIFTLGRTAHLLSPLAPPGVQEDLSSRFVDILNNDTEGFARRAVMKVFSIWLISPHLHLQESLEKHLSTVLRLGREDLDWEVKVHTLELVQVLIDKTLGVSSLSPCPYLSDIPAVPTEGVNLAEALQSLHEQQVFDMLFSALLDCDRPVAQKACAILLHLKGVVAGNTDALDATVTFDLKACSWGQEILNRHVEKCSSADMAVCVNIVELLSRVDLEEMQQALDQSSSHLENSPRSLMKDILAAAHTTEDNTVDCY